jgi:hypothetical protein
MEWPQTDVSRIQVIVDTMSPIDGFETEAGEFETFLKEADVELVAARNVVFCNVTTHNDGRKAI